MPMTFGKIEIGTAFLHQIGRQLLHPLQPRGTQDLPSVSSLGHQTSACQNLDVVGQGRAGNRRSSPKLANIEACIPRPDKNTQHAQSLFRSKGRESGGSRYEAVIGDL